MPAQNRLERFAVHRIVRQGANAAIQFGRDPCHFVCGILEERAGLLRTTLVHGRLLGADPQLIPSARNRIGASIRIIAVCNGAQVVGAGAQAFDRADVEAERGTRECTRRVLQHARPAIGSVLARNLGRTAHRTRRAIQLLDVGRFSVQCVAESFELLHDFGDEEVVQCRHQPSPLRMIVARAACTISAMSRTARSIPVKNARLTTLCPMFSSSISGTAATAATFS